MENPRKPIRWWPLLLLMLGVIAGLIFVWVVREDRPMQTKFTRTVIIGAASSFLFLLWVLFLSRLRWKIRLGFLAMVIVLGVAARFSLEIRGVTGDLFPIIEFRWKPKHTVAAASSAPNNPPALTNSWIKVPGEFLGLYGPDRNAALPGVALETNWTTHAPKLLWKIPVGQSWSGFAVKDGLAITQEQREQHEYVVCYEVVSGRVLWTHSDEARYSTTIAGEGPRATPTIASNRVYTFGATGILNCLDLESGEHFWSRDTVKENEAGIGDWGLTSSPLVVDGKVIVSVGGKNGRSLVAYHAETGEFAWGAGDAGADYSSPLLARLGDTPQIVIFNGAGVVAHDLAGTILWQYPWKGGHPHITPPLVISTNELLVSSGYGTGAELLTVARDPSGKWSASQVWKSMAIKSKFGPLFRVGDFVYGLDDGIMACADLKTGSRRWKDGRYGHGQGLLLGDQILLTSEKGELVLIQPNPDQLIELAKLPLFSDKTWNPPALAGEYLLARNHKEAACLKLSLRSTQIALAPAVD